jgi:hypothetical protein
MDMMAIRRRVLMASKKKERIKFEFALDGSIHNFDTVFPNDNFSILAEVPPVVPSAANTAIQFVQSSNTTNYTRYFTIGFYQTYYYFDTGGSRQAWSVNSGYLKEQSHRFGASISNGQSRKCCDNSVVVVKNTVIENAGTIIGNYNKRNQAEPNTVTVYLYNRVLTDVELQNYTQNGILP